MSKKHFNALAQAMANVRPYNSTPLTDRQVVELFQWHRDIQAIAAICESMSPRFNWHRFIDACERWEAK
jgi:hypothetical protein